MNNILTTAKEVTELKAKAKEALEKSRMFSVYRPGEEHYFDAEMAELSGCQTFDEYQEFARNLRRTWIALDEEATEKALEVHYVVNTGNLDADTKAAVLNEMRKW